jgi:hypothetical protein
MNLNGSITDLQNAEIQVYLKLAHRFKDNGLIREFWSAMANDVSQQKSSLKALPISFWKQMQKSHSELTEAIIPYARHQADENTEDMPLKACFDVIMQFEEPTILKIYVPIIRSLRENRTNPALDFYITLKAHLARIVRITGSFSGDPIVIQRSSLLLQSFEKAVQEPQAKNTPLETKAQAKRAARRKDTANKSKKALKQAGTLAKRAKTLHHRAKPLVKKVELQRRRARR